MSDTAVLGYRAVLRLPSVGPLFSATLLSRLAETAFTLALVLHVLDRSASPSLTGLVTAAALLPGMVASPIAGALLDRLGSARAILVDLVLSALLVAALGLVDAGGPAGTVLLVALAAGYSLTSPLNLAGVRVLIPRLVPPGGHDTANALDTSSYNVVDIVGPVLAGVLFGLAGGRVTLLVLAGLYAAAAVAMLPLAARRFTAATGRRPLLAAAAAGVAYVLRHPVLRGLSVCYSLYQLAWGALVVAVPVAVAGADGRLDGDSGLVGGAWAVAGVAGAVGALAVGRLRTAGRERAFIAAGLLATGLAAAVVLPVGGAWGLLTGLGLVGLASGAVNVGLLTLRQRRTDPDWLGRVLAVSISLNLLGLPLGTLVGGWVAQRSAVLAFLTAGASAVLGALACLLLLPAERALACPTAHPLAPTPGEA